MEVFVSYSIPDSTFNVKDITLRIGVVVITIIYSFLNAHPLTEIYMVKVFSE